MGFRVQNSKWLLKGNKTIYVFLDIICLLVFHIYASQIISKQSGLINDYVIIGSSQNSRESSLFETRMLRLPYYPI